MRQIHGDTKAPPISAGTGLAFFPLYVYFFAEDSSNAIKLQGNKTACCTAIHGGAWHAWQAVLVMRALNSSTTICPVLCVGLTDFAELPLVLRPASGTVCRELVWMVDNGSSMGSSINPSTRRAHSSVRRVDTNDPKQGWNFCASL